MTPTRRFSSDEHAEFETWDGRPVAVEPPHGVMVVCLRRLAEQVEVLVLHRAHHGPDYEGDWAWTPPSGARLPGESVMACARRELREEAGLELDPEPIAGDGPWAVFRVDVSHHLPELVDAEHDRYEWVSAEEAVRRCRPQTVADGITLALT